MNHFAKSQNLLLNDLFCIGKVYTLYLPHNTNNMTAIEWLINEMPVIDWSDPYWKTKLDKAKEIEKQQILDAYHTGAIRTLIEHHNTNNGLIYYNETYGK